MREGFVVLPSFVELSIQSFVTYLALLRMFNRYNSFFWVVIFICGYYGIFRASDWGWMSTKLRSADWGCVQKPLRILRIFRSGLVRGDTRMCTLLTDTKVSLSSVCALQCLHSFTSLTCFFILQNMLSIFRIYINNNNNILVNHCKIMKTRYLDNKLIVSLYRGWFVFVIEWPRMRSRHSLIYKPNPLS